MADPRDAELLNLRAYVGTLERQLADAKELAEEYQHRASARSAARMRASGSRWIFWCAALPAAVLMTIGDYLAEIARGDA